MSNIEDFRAPFLKAAAANTGAAAPMFQELITTFDKMNATITGISADFGKAGQKHEAVMGRIYKESYAGMSRFQGIAARIRSVAKSDPRAGEALDELGKALTSELNKVLPQAAAWRAGPG